MKKKKKKNLRKTLFLIIASISIFTAISFKNNLLTSKDFYINNKLKHCSNSILLAVGNPYTGYKPKIVPGENIIESANSYAIPADEVAKMISGNSLNNQKTVFLTFDDGPSINNTPKILNILKENNVHATFFIIGNNLNNNSAIQNITRMTLANGNAIGNHTFDHNLKLLYPHNKISPQEVLSQIDKTNNLLNAILGGNFCTRVFRLPGGNLSRVYYHDENLDEFNSLLKSKNIISLDWDAESGDSDPTMQMNVEKQIEMATKKNSSEKHIIILMHDCGARTDTVEALPHIIKYYKNKGYSFKVIKNSNKYTFIPTLNNSYEGTKKLLNPLIER